MIDRCYDQKDLVALYDLINSGGPDWDYYLALAARIVGAEKAPARVLDAGCGTGALAVEMARMGAEVTGLDPAEAMLAVARARAGAALVHWQHGTLQSFHSDQRYDLIYMTGHAFQCLLADDDILQAFLAVAAVLAQAGSLCLKPVIRPVRRGKTGCPHGLKSPWSPRMTWRCGFGINWSRSQTITSPLINITPLRIARPR